MSNEEITELQVVEKAAKRRRVNKKKEEYIAEWALLVDENDRLKQEINRLRNRGFWARVFNR